MFPLPVSCAWADEESGCCKPRDRRLRDAVGAGQFCLRFPIGKAPESFCLLVRRESTRPSESHAAVLGALAAFTGASPDQLALELSQPAQYCQHQSAVRRCGVCPCVPETAEVCVALADSGQYIEQVAG